VHSQLFFVEFKIYYVENFIGYDFESQTEKEIPCVGEFIFEANEIAIGITTERIILFNFGIKSPSRPVLLLRHDTAYPLFSKIYQAYMFLIGFGVDRLMIISNYRNKDKILNKINQKSVLAGMNNEFYSYFDRIVYHELQRSYS
jgi:hypothetical protein